jgi:hypothetical protein
MASQHLPDIVHIITQVLQQRGKTHLTLRQALASLPANVRRTLGLTPRLSTAELLKKLTPLLGDTLQVYHGTTSVYIGQKYSATAFLVQQVQQRPGISPKQLGLRVPLSKQAFVTALNTLLETGTVVCTFKDTYMPTLRIAHPAPPMAVPQSHSGEDRAAFWRAYRQVGQGRSFVRIHRLRDALPWPRQQFERMLEALAADYTIELHGGDPSVMTTEELRQSFTTADGTLYIALSWRGES